MMIGIKLFANSVKLVTEFFFFVIFVSATKLFSTKQKNQLSVKNSWKKLIA